MCLDSEGPVIEAVTTGPRCVGLSPTLWLAALAGDGPVLELAVGTGRLALPLAATGVRVDGVELSEAMIEQLRAKPGGAEMTVVSGDMTTVALPDRYSLVFIVFNSLMNVMTQDGQVDTVANAARHLTDDGVFVVENVVPDAMYRLDLDRDGVDQYVLTEEISTDGVMVEVGRYDRVSQRVDKCHVRLTSAGIELDPLALRYVWPSELDLMARLAGLSRRAVGSVGLVSRSKHEACATSRCTAADPFWARDALGPAAAMSDVRRIATHRSSWNRTPAQVSSVLTKR